MTEYRTLSQYPGYRFGSDGTVWSCWKKLGQGRGVAPVHVQSDQWRQLNPSPDAYGCAVLSLGRGKSRRVGRLILEAFVGSCPAGEECCHFPDPDPMNCRLENLRWDSSAANTDDQRQHGHLIGGERHGMAKLANAQIEEIRALAGTMSQRAIGERFGIKQPHVSDILRGKKRTPSSHAGKGNHHG